MSRASKITKKLRETKNILKVISVFLSLFLWFFVLKSQPVSIEESLKIQYQIPDGYSFTVMPQDKISVYLEGLRATLRRSDIEKNKVKIPIPKLGDDKFIYTAIIPSTSFPQPSGVKIKDYHPKKLRLELEKTVTKSVPIKIQHRIDQTQGLRISSISVSPESVIISGPGSKVNLIQEIKTDNFDVDYTGLDELEKEVEIKIPELIKLEELASAVVSVRLNFEAKEPIKKQLTVPIKFITDGNNNFKPSAKTALVSIEYMKEYKETPGNKEKEFELDIYADLTSHNINANNVIPLRGEKPNWVRIITIQPSYITIE